ncbi:hypothetical protein D3C73_523190 [compost metagenome]
MLFLQSYPFQKRRSRFLALFPLVDAVDFHRLADQLQHIQTRIQRRIRVLKDRLNAAAERLQPLLPQLAERLSIEEHFSASIVVQPEQAAPDRRLPAAGFAHQPEGFPLADLEAYAIDCFYYSSIASAQILAFGEVLLEVIHIHQYFALTHRKSSPRHMPPPDSAYPRPASTWSGGLQRALRQADVRCSGQKHGGSAP